MKTKIVLKSLIILAVSFSAISCACESNSTKKNESEKVAVVGNAMTVDAVYADAANLVGKEVTVEGICTHICKHAGKKIFLMGETLSIRVEGDQVKRFDQKCVNSIVEVKGIVTEERIGEAYLQRWEAEFEQQQKEAHGDEEDGCTAEQQARNEKTASSTTERIANFRSQIAASVKNNGKDYLSFYHISPISYEVK